jgi:hypothetical protein
VRGSGAVEPPASATRRSSTRMGSSEASRSHCASSSGRATRVTSRTREKVSRPSTKARSTCGNARNARPIRMHSRVRRTLMSNRQRAAW